MKKYIAWFCLGMGLVVSASMLSWFVPLLFMITSPTVSVEATSIHNHPVYNTLTANEKELLEKVIDRVESSSKREYYFGKLKQLLDTPVNPLSEVAENNYQFINNSISQSMLEVERNSKILEISQFEYMSIEERYEQVVKHNWKKYKPNAWSPNFFVDTDNPLKIFANIKVRLHGSFDDVDKILFLEDAIEKHLNITGFSVNLIFVESSYDNTDVFDVMVNPNEWTSSYNWAGDHKSLAHELLHLMGIADEYDRIESHSTNRDLPIYDRLEQFNIQMDKTILPDAAQGIMAWQGFRPLQRHVCAAVGLNQECVDKRVAAYDTK